ncbi:hypothetical protein OF83DRAFT_560612 [Amylostereum chailletii]|nr:hypothetical protein OF83DRAFT_560612 [Amylostereum chailletii]
MAVVASPPRVTDAFRARDAVFPPLPSPPPPLNLSTHSPPTVHRIGLYHSLSHHSLSRAFRAAVAERDAHNNNNNNNNNNNGSSIASSPTLARSRSLTASVASPHAHAHGSHDGCQHHKHFCKPSVSSRSSVLTGTSSTVDTSGSDAESFPSRSRSRSSSPSSASTLDMETDKDKDDGARLVFEHPRGRSLERERERRTSAGTFASSASSSTWAHSPDETPYAFLSREYLPPPPRRRTRMTRSGSTRARSRSVVSVRDPAEAADGVREEEPAVLLTYAFEGEMAYVPAGRTYDVRAHPLLFSHRYPDLTLSIYMCVCVCSQEAIAYASEAFPALGAYPRASIRLHVAGADGAGRVRVPRVAWAELRGDLPRYGVVYVEVAMEEEAPPRYDGKRRSEEKERGRGEEKDKEKVDGLGGWMKGLFRHGHGQHRV